jgi:hypothetical protein
MALAMVGQSDVVLERLGSRRLALGLFFAVSAFGLYGSLVPAERATRVFAAVAGGSGLAAARFLGLADTYRSPVFVALLALLAVNLLACTVPRFTRSRASSRGPVAAWLDLLLHLSLLLVLAGAAAKALWGSTLTANVRVGEAIAEAYDWRLNADVPLGFTVAVAERRTDYYPASVRVGVRGAATGEKIALLELAEQAPARVPGHEISLILSGFAEDPARFLFSTAPDGGTFGLEARAEQGGTVTRGGLSFTLVAYRQEIKSVRGLVRVLEGDQLAAEGWLGSNERLEHKGTSLFLTAWGTDEQKRRFIGLQFVRDPGAPLFWAGCVLLAALLPAYLLVRHPRGEASRPGE